MAKSDIYQELSVRTPTVEYPVIIGRDFLLEGSLFLEKVLSRQVLIVTNKTVAPLYLHYLLRIFSDRQCDVVLLEDGEEFKNQQSLFQIYNTLIDKKHHRDTTVIALGGGVIGDISGFAASTYQRGVNFLQIPTTLLSQVDASVGGKTAINLPNAKNMVGSFYQPNAVIMDLGTLQTLPLREFRAGLAEIIKYAILEGGNFLALVHSALKNGLADNVSDQLPAIISQCCQIKASFVEADERELGQRALLNLGHTVGHALEAYTHYTRWLHGEAVAIGLYAAALLSHKYYGLDKNCVDLIDNLLFLAGLPRRIPKDINLDELRALMDQDKKVKNNSLRFILIRDMGDCYLLDKLPEANINTLFQCVVEGD